MTPRRRVATLLGATIAVTFAVQWPDLSGFLDDLVGLDWSSGIVQFLRQNTQGLIVFVMLGLFFEWSGLRQTAEEAHRESRTALRLLEDTLRSSSGRPLMELGLASIYGEQAARQFSNNLFRDCNVLKNVRVSITVLPHPSGYEIEAELSYSCDQKVFVAAVVNSPSLSEALLRTGVVSEVFVVTEECKGVPAVVTRIDDDPRSGEKIVSEIAFDELTGSRKSRLFSGVNLKIPMDSFRVYSGRSDKKGSLAEYTYRITHRAHQPSAEAFTFWMNDRVIQIDSVDVNLRALGEEVFKKARLYRFLASSQWTANLGFETGRCILPLNTWSVAGDGIFVTWPQKQ